MRCERFMSPVNSKMFGDQMQLIGMIASESQLQIRTAAKNEQPKQEKVKKTVDVMMRSQAPNQANQQLINIKEQSDQIITIDDVLNGLVYDDEIANDGELSDID